MKRIVLTLLLVLVLAAVPAFARSTYYFTGDTLFCIRAGVTFPSFFSFYNNPDKGTVTFEDTHMTLGGTASIAYQGFVNEQLAIGGQLEYAFNYSRADIIMTTVPITAKLTWIPVQTGTFDLAMSVNLGGAFIRYNNGKYFAPYAAVTITPSFFVSDNWGLGIETGLMATAEIYLKNSNKYDQSAIAGLMPITLVLTYRH